MEIHVVAKSESVNGSDQDVLIDVAPGWGEGMGPGWGEGGVNEAVFAQAWLYHATAGIFEWSGINETPESHGDNPVSMSAWVTNKTLDEVVTILGEVAEGKTSYGDVPELNITVYPCDGS